MPTYTTSQELDPLLPFIFLFPSAVFNGLFFTFIAYSHVVRFLRNRQETSTLTSVRARVPSPFIVYLHLRSLHQCLTLFSFFFFLAPVRATVTGTVTFGASLTYRSYSPAFPFFFPQKPQQSVFFFLSLSCRAYIQQYIFGYIHDTCVSRHGEATILYIHSIQ